MQIAIRNETGFDLFLAVTVREKFVKFRLYSRKPRKPMTRRLPDGASHGILDRPKHTHTSVNRSKSATALFAVKKTRRIVSLDGKSRVRGKETYILYTIRLAN